MSRAEWPARYEIRVDAILNGRWIDWYEWLQVVAEDEVTTLTGIIPDQSALRGVLMELGDLGISIILVRRMPDP